LYFDANGYIMYSQQLGSILLFGSNREA